jgi:putative acyl-CoA dehydrogenase
MHKVTYNWFKEEGRTIEGPRLGNQFREDVALMRFLEYFLSKENCDPKTRTKIYTELESLGNNTNVYQKFGFDAEANPPTLTKYSVYGEKINQINTSQGWKECEKAALKERIINQAYTQEFGPLSRLIEMIKIYIFHPSTAYWTCPMAMTDGGAF